MEPLPHSHSTPQRTRRTRVRPGAGRARPGRGGATRRAGARAAPGAARVWGPARGGRPPAAAAPPRAGGPRRAGPSEGRAAGHSSQLSSAPAPRCRQRRSRRGRRHYVLQCLSRGVGSRGGTVSFYCTASVLEELSARDHSIGELHKCSSTRRREKSVMIDLLLCKSISDQTNKNRYYT